MKIQALANQLLEFGLSTKEAEVFVALIQKPASTVQELARVSKVKRPTAYHILISLLSKGLISETGEKIKRYTAVSPRRFASFVEEKKHEIELLEKSLPNLFRSFELIATTENDEFTVQKFSGKNGVRSLFDSAFQAKNKRWDIIAPYNNYLRNIDEDFGSYYLKARKYHGIRSRTLWDKGYSGRRLTQEEIQLRNPRYMPETMSNKFNALLILFDNSVAFVSYMEGGGGVIITSKDIYKIVHAMFETIWAQSEVYV